MHDQFFHMAQMVPRSHNMDTDQAMTTSEVHMRKKLICSMGMYETDLSKAYI